MSIYTKTGDQGQTSLFGGVRVSKTSVQIEAYGQLDELTSILGLVAVKLTHKKEKEVLLEIQKDLYKIMGSLAGAKQDLSYLDKRVDSFEKTIDELDKKLPKLTKFILPGGTELAAWFHIARTVCRRTERSIIAFAAMKQLNNETMETILKYINRLADLFFMLARFYSKTKEVLA